MRTGGSRPRRLALTVLFLFLAAADAGAAPETMPFDEVQPGMVGIGRTVFKGTQIEDFEVEILGKLENFGPDQNLILGRCSGGPLAETGVLAGMSGSPVTIDGKLIGAIAYSWGFTKDAIAGITPIEEMLAIASRETGKAIPSGTGSAVARQLELLHRPSQLDRFFVAEAGRLLRGAYTSLPTSVPLAISGMRSSALMELFPGLVAAGFLPVQSGGGTGAGLPTPDLQPGSAIGFKLVRGDIEMVATGTVTWIDGDQVLAFGHPLFGLGPVDLPLTGATVQALIPSLQQSTKIATPLDELGAMRQDRATGVFGRLGVEPRMIPVRLQLSGSNDEERTFSFDIADDPQLSALLLFSSLRGILASRERVFGAVSLRLGQGSVIKMLSGEDIALDNLYSGSNASDYGTAIPAYILYLLMNNDWETPRIAGINLILDFDPRPQTARISRVSLSRYRAHAGETVTVTVMLNPYRGHERLISRGVVIPHGTPPGPLKIIVSGAVEASRGQAQEERIVPQDLEQLIDLINRLRRNDHVYIQAHREDSGVVLDGNRLPGLPPSVVGVLSLAGKSGNLRTVSRRSVLEEAIATEFSIAGSTKLTLEVEAP